MSICFFVLIGLHLIHLPKLHSIRAGLINKEKQQAEVAQRYDELTAEIARFNQRKETIVQIRHTRLLWAKKFDRLCDLVPPYIWFSNIRLEKPRPDQKDVGGKFILDCYSQGPDESHFADFMRILKGEVEDEEIGRIGQEFFQDFLWLDAPSGWSKEVLKGFQPPEALKFKLELPLKKKGLPEAEITSSLPTSGSPQPARPRR